ncbi:MAG: C4-dicarboxylate ABC transporter [OM182 bacterium MED-G24]|uniref:C4-dicarboxylate ABC transporter n=1 Tax=OM182 bacterium MED-G24 TaxID=1986255 RepID=A0A2A5WSI2_9GAMM|nr:MAG: C4-dicarboxylate ABC transporter [OM182 bacterium MED-G24]|tara:strand:+ start:4232 stop:5383 length:1152 start_codon:yes stop_codon:yes gene_type:complete
MSDQQENQVSATVASVWTNRTAGFAVLIAFIAGLVGALVLRDHDRSTAVVAETSPRSSIYWRVPVAFNTNLPGLGENVLRIAADSDAISDGRIRFEVFEPGMLIPPFSITEGVRDGKIKAGYTWLGYDQGRIPATPLVSAVPFGMEPWEFTAWYYEDEGQALTEALYEPHFVHPILCGIVGPETAGWFREPVTSLSDLEGLKIRFAGLGGRVLQELGASVTMIPGGEIFQALEKGAIDATEYSMPAVDQKLGFDRIASFNYFPGWHQTFTASYLVVNLSTWRALHPADQALIDTVCTAGVIRNLSRGESLQGEVLQGFPAKGVSPRKLSVEILEQLAAVTEQVLIEEAANDEDFDRIWESQKRFLRSYRVWKDHAYLPRDFGQ